LTETVTVNGAPVQVPEDGVRLYVAVATLAVVLVSRSCRVLCPVPEAPPERPLPRVGAAHAYVPVTTVPVGV